MFSESDKNTPFLCIDDTEQNLDKTINSEAINEVFLELRDIDQNAVSNGIHDHNPDAYHQLAYSCFGKNNKTLYLISLKHALVTLSKHSPSHSDDASLSTYEKLLLDILRIWNKIAKADIIPATQLSLWLPIFACPKYQMLSAQRFFDVLEETVIMLLSLQAQCKKLILLSPHWYLSIITDLLVGLLDQMEINSFTNELNAMEMDLSCSKAISSIGRVWNALGPEDPETKPDISHFVKCPLENVVVRYSEINSTELSKLRINRPTILVKHVRKLNTSVIGPLSKRNLNICILHPMLKICDSWVLGQMRIGMKPNAAKITLNEFIKEMDIDHKIQKPTHSIAACLPNKNEKSGNKRKFVK
ncbi:hypothetical protein Ciccas_002530 [Cichlidogyrus casuarinus]|uniref:Uncharacterized protein n=1 Tax=Cichlidogyrus casuarinus TaxID=1844966 RepID=A0ABD2QGY9_9PLAT